MNLHGIAKYVGSWVSASGHSLQIRLHWSKTAEVDLYGPRQEPIARAYMDGAPSQKMEVSYDEYYDDFRVYLWDFGRGFCLHLDHETAYALDPHRQEALVPSISRYEEDAFLDQYYPLFGPLQHFVRENGTEPVVRENAG